MHPRVERPLSSRATRDSRPMTKVGQRAALIRPPARKATVAYKECGNDRKHCRLFKLAGYPHRPHCSRAWLCTGPFTVSSW